MTIGSTIQEGDEIRPTVSVVITSYNSSKHIKQAVESVLEQRVSFPIEIVISDDCSQDDTISIAENFREQHPAVFCVIARTKNVGTQRNYYEAFERSRGKYIAWLDADDYWTDPEKLTIQVSALEADASLMICGHYVRWVSRESQRQVQRERFPALPPGRYGMESILRSNFLPSPAVMFRNGLQRQMPDWYFDVSPLTDWPLYVTAAQRGDILLLDRVMADYTLNADSAFWGEGEFFWYKQNAEFYSRLEGMVAPRFRRTIRREKGFRYEAMAYILRKKGNFAESRRIAVKAFFAPRITDNVLSKTKALAASVVREVQSRFRH